jgi:hypothetical protein
MVGGGKKKGSALLKEIPNEKRLDVQNKKLLSQTFAASRKGFCKKEVAF